MQGHWFISKEFEGISSCGQGTDVTKKESSTTANKDNRKR